MGLKGQSHRGANGRDSGRQTEKKGDETRQRRQWECMFHSRNKRLYELTTIFEERARAQEWTASFYERTSHIAILSYSPKRNRENPASFPFPYRSRPFRTVSNRFLLLCTMLHQCYSLQLLWSIVSLSNLVYSFDIWFQFGLFLTVRME